MRTQKFLWFRSIVWVSRVPKIDGRTFAPLSVFQNNALWRHHDVTGDGKFFSFKYRHIVYRWKGNFKLIKSLFKTYVWKSTPWEIISTQWRHYDVTDTVQNTDFSKIDILYTVGKEISSWLKVSFGPLPENKLLRNYYADNGVIMTSSMQKKIFFFKNRHIKYRWKENFNQIKSLFRTYAWKLTPEELSGKQRRHNDVIVAEFLFSKIDIIYCWKGNFMPIKSPFRTYAWKRIIKQTMAS